MEKVIETPPLKDPTQSEDTLLGFKTPPPPQKQDLDEKLHLSGTGDTRKPGAPDRLSVPKAFKYPERYRSPTDLMMSPISKGLLARTRKGALLPPSKNQPKIQDVGIL